MKTVLQKIRDAKAEALVFCPYFVSLSNTGNIINSLFKIINNPPLSTREISTKNCTAVWKALRETNSKPYKIHVI